MKVLHVCASDSEGGAARATYRIHQALVEHGPPLGIESRMRVIRKLSDDPTVIGGPPAGESTLWRRLQPRLANWRYRSFHTENTAAHSVAWPATGLGDELIATDADVIHLHWLGNETLSVEEIGQLHRPVVWTLHDAWAFCGAEHYVNPPPAVDERFAEGYTAASRPAHEFGADLNRKTWLRKCRAWRRPMYIVCPSQWLADCAQRSVLMRDWPVTVIPYPIDLVRWAPLDRFEARSLLGLPPDRPLVLFCGLATDSRKGVDLLIQSLQRLRAEATGTTLNRLELVVISPGQYTQTPEFGFPAHFLGRLHDDISLRLYYAAADVVVIPSRQDNLPCVGLEALACGTPVVAFDLGGLPEIVDHMKNGYLAMPLDPEALRAGIAWVLTQPVDQQQLSLAARAKAETKWASDDIAKQYGNLYARAVSY